MESDIPYQTLNKKRRWVLWCFRTEEESDPKDVSLKKINEAINIIDMKIKYINFKVTKLKSEAKLNYTQDAIMSKEMLNLSHKLNREHLILAKFWTNLQEIKFKIENASTMQDVSNAMSDSNRMLEVTTGELDIEKIAQTMSDISFNINSVDKINDALADPITIDNEIENYNFPEAPKDRQIKKEKVLV
jgi:hypothetical protein